MIAGTSFSVFLSSTLRTVFPSLTDSLSALSSSLQQHSGSNLRDILEMIYFLSAPLLLIVASIGLIQLRLSKQASRLSAAREAYRLAAEQIAFYCNHIIPLQNKLDETIKSKGITLFEQTKVTIEGNSVKIQFPPKISVMADVESYLKEFLDCFNSMEGFAVYFVNKIALENIAFSSVGSTYCHHVRQYLALLVTLSDGDSFRNLLQLFFLWNSRIEKNKLTRQMHDIESKIKKVDGRFIKPLGL